MRVKRIQTMVTGTENVKCEHKKKKQDPSENAKQGNRILPTASGKNSN